MELTRQDYLNLKVCCVKVAKSPEVNEQEMSELLNLSRKLDIVISQLDVKEKTREINSKIDKKQAATDTTETVDATVVN